ncbi:FAD-binding oxidoreductase [Salinisphaera sp. SPP-AMP-43]|uniref:NAD(P)/FAD-dependent oxidoreductase n=1 Tax=Salinisphaera sp. SPP-AMP-43 TaxID=3121288 RepID=UPI003C6DF073
MSSPHSEIPSLWAAQTAPGPDLPQLDQEIDADVAIVGGGYSGLSAAHYLAERGLRPVVLEADRIGWGASGRNGGVVSAKYRVSYPAIAQTFGLETAQLMHRISHEAVDLVESLIERFDLHDAEFARAGNLRCAHNTRSLSTIAAAAEWQRRELGDRQMSILSRDQVVEETGSNAFVGGVLAADVGRLRPLAYARGLAAGLQGYGSDLIFENSPVERIETIDQGLILHTPQGRVRAGQAILASNGYSSLTPATAAIERTLVPFRSAIIATEPLDAELDRRLLAQRRSYTETRRMMRWFRRVDDRFVFGGRGAFGTKESASAFQALQRAMVALFPELANTGIAYQWSGHVAMTADKFPHVGRLNDRVCCTLGYNGAGVALSTLLGRYAGAFALREAPEVGPLDVANLQRIPFYPLRQLGIRSVAGWYQFLDAIGL